jgi:hypothetical protein
MAGAGVWSPAYAGMTMREDAEGRGAYTCNTVPGLTSVAVTP